MSKNRLYFLILFASLMVSGLHAKMAFARLHLLQTWQGEYLAAKEGLLYLKIHTLGFGGSSFDSGTSDVQVVFQNILTKSYYRATIEPDEAKTAYPKLIFRLPSGKYRMFSMELIDTKDKARKWRGGKKGKRFVVKRQNMSNLGLFLLRPKGRSGLSTSFKMLKNAYTEGGSRSDSSVAYVINGFSGRRQVKIGGKNVEQGADSDYAGKNEIRETYSVKRTIEMLYSLNLFKHNSEAQGIMNVLQHADRKMRQCYMDRLERKPKLKGTINFSALFSKKTGTIRKIRASGGSIDDPKLIGCLLDQMSQLSFAVRYNMIGKMIYTFNVK